MLVAPLARFWTRLPLICGLACAGLALTGPLLSSTAQACSCMMPPSAVMAKDQSAMVFRGEVLSIRSTTGPIGPGGQGTQNLNEVQFRVDDLWKGDTHEQLTLRTPSDSAACGRNFAVGQTYLVYARTDARGFTDNLCTRTQSQAAAIASDMQALGAPKWHRASQDKAPTGQAKAPGGQAPEGQAKAPAGQGQGPESPQSSPPALTPGRRCAVALPTKSGAGQDFGLLAMALGLLLVFRARAR